MSVPRTPLRGVTSNRPRFAWLTLVLKHPGALRAMLLPSTEVGLGEAYLYDD